MKEEKKTIELEKLKAKPIYLKEANEFVKRFHRHSLPTTGGRFAVAAEKDGKVVGVMISGRPIARLLDNGETLEVLRVATDGTKNANSFLYGVAIKIARLMGYKKVITYNLSKESGSSLKAIGACPIPIPAQSWDRPNRTRKKQPVYRESKNRWEIIICPPI